MNWLTFIVLGGGMILLGLAIIFLLFAEIASKIQDSEKKAGRETRTEIRFCAVPKHPTLVQHGSESGRKSRFGDIRKRGEPGRSRGCREFREA